MSKLRSASRLFTVLLGLVSAAFITCAPAHAEDFSVKLEYFSLWGSASFDSGSFTSGPFPEENSSVEGVVKCGSKLSFTAVPKKGYRFDHWNCNWNGFSDFESASVSITVPPYEKISSLNQLTFWADFEPDHKHVLKYVPAKKYTCTKDGNLEHYRCTVCGSLFDDAKGENQTWPESVRWPAAHMPERISLEEPTGRKAGRADCFRCSVCGRYFADEMCEAEIPASAALPAARITPSHPLKLSRLKKLIRAQKADADLKGASFSQMKARAKTVTKTSVTLSWKKVSGAESYIIYSNYSGRNKAMTKKASVRKRTWTRKGLRRGRHYRFVVAAVRGNQVLALSDTIYVTTKGGTRGNVSGIRIKGSTGTLRLAAGGSRKIEGVLQKGDKRQKKRVPVRYESKDPTVAAVGSDGTVTAVAKGKTYVYAIAQNGLCAYTKVIVK